MALLSARGATALVTLVPVLAGMPAAASATAPTPSSRLIVPGRSIGGVAVGQTFTRAKALWGPGAECFGSPFPGPPGEPEPRSCTWVVGPDGNLGTASISGTTRDGVTAVDISAALGPDGLAVTSPLRALRTARSIGLGSSGRAVRRAYPRALRKVITGFAYPYVDYVLRGPGNTKTTFEVRGPAQRVAVIRLGY